jgi:hypothetical protein
MPVVSRVIVVSSEARVADAVRFGFERAGASVSALPMADALSARLTGELAAQPAPPASGGAASRGTASRPGTSPGTVRPVLPDLVVAGADTAEHAGALLGALRRALDGKEREVPILCLGPTTLSRAAALEAGASELLPAPAFVRDTVTLGQLLVTSARASRQHVVEGHLSDYGGVFFLARAMAAVERTAVLSLVRGLRRGELRFYRGQITSAQVGMLHGMAALHQLLLWTRAHFELRDEDVVPRRQIPLSTEEILADAERFLHEMRSVMGMLVPSEVYELVPEQVDGNTASIPAAVCRIVQLIDGYRTMADVIEDSPYRVLETARLANRLAELGWIRPGRTAQNAPTPLVGSLRKSSISVEQMLANELSESGAAIGTVELQSIPGSSKSAAVDGGGGKDALDGEPGDAGETVHEGDGQVPRDEDASDAGEEADAAGESAPAQPEEPPARHIDWSDVLPIEMSTGFSPVVPSTVAAGEILSRDELAGDAGGGSDMARGVEAGLRQRVPAVSERDQAARAARAGSAERQAGTSPPRAGDGDPELARPPSVSPAPARPRKNLAALLWKRLFGRGRSAPDSEDDAPRPGGKRGRRRRSRQPR